LYCKKAMQKRKMENKFTPSTNWSSFPTTRYYGSKRRLLPWIYDVSSKISFNSVFDRFGGTASVSLLFQNMGKKVVYHDALASNSISARALLSTNTLNENDVTLFFDNIKPKKGFISETFNDIYYSNEENQWLDGAVEKIHQLDNENLKNYCWYCLFQACLKKRPFNMFHRANYYLRTANVERKFGNLTTWNKSFLSHIDVANKEIYQYLQQRQSHILEASILPSGEMKKQDIDADLVYLDPPYIGQSSCEDYFKRYHFLEGLTCYSGWADLIDKSKATKQIHTPDYLKSWHNKNTFKEVLFGEIEGYQHKIVMLSYQTDGYPKIDSIYDFFVSLFSTVHIHKKPFTHALSKSKKTEVLIIGFPK